jgi:hypothetical protein
VDVATGAHVTTHLISPEQQVQLPGLRVHGQATDEQRPHLKQTNNEFHVSAKLQLRPCAFKGQETRATYLALTGTRGNMSRDGQEHCSAEWDSVLDGRRNKDERRVTSTQGRKRIEEESHVFLGPPVSNDQLRIATNRRD